MHGSKGRASHETERRSVLESSSRHNLVSAIAGHVYRDRQHDHGAQWSHGYPAEQRKEAEKRAAASPQNPFSQAVIFAALGNKDRPSKLWSVPLLAGPFRMGRALTLPEFALLRGDPRLKALRKKVGLPE